MPQHNLSSFDAERARDRGITANAALFLVGAIIVAIGLLILAPVPRHEVVAVAELPTGQIAVEYLDGGTTVSTVADPTDLRTETVGDRQFQTVRVPLEHRPYGTRVVGLGTVLVLVSFTDLVGGVVRRDAERRFATERRRELAVS